ncbi:MAG: D-alanyl-D-alanine carboxypeptidase [Clostridiales bacterium]|nr:D-alanyl-D-alanine carboxypeptidase [Clostridiales bacterium]
MKKIKLKPAAYLLLLLIILIPLIIIGIALKSCGNSEEPVPTEEETTETTVEATPTPTPTPTPWDTNFFTNINSSNAILIDAETGDTINELLPDTRMYPASMTKMMTALVVFDNVTDLDSTTTLDQHIFDDLFGNDASSAGFENGETVSIRDLLYGCMLPSGAECCLGLADYVAGSEAEFVELMNEKAAELGMINTHFTNCTGLQDEQHFSTVRDMSILLRALLQKPILRTIITSPSYTVSPTNMHPEGFTFYNTLINGLNNRGYGTDLIRGGKTGYTAAAGQCLASFAVINGHEYILVTAGAMGDPYNGDALHIDDAIMVYQSLQDYLMI